MVASGRTLNRFSIQLERRAEGKEALAHIAPLNETKATNSGAEFFSELIIYGIAGATVVYEYRLNEGQKTQKEREAAKKEVERRTEMARNEARQWDEFSALNSRISALEVELSALRQQADLASGGGGEDGGVSRHIDSRLGGLHKAGGRA
eukprot:CAMPEP_0181215666 /NCGR_PEP_ID=MMETSP1096-20121128/26138_1 /TAXON_ID=156174 ORGANISM="Chrysochromulina ericina, Strain CCMP281" /NCGR_SAMPLE_ID=MMETSP1096 /ASSEMBLY_ACC=CAM_ASM_000453 /LENGTH=149 /DNA_ID=CAMNT_0023307543 /DNA_START=39 /DNA_END=489 /DNA_ORIENTATION=+